MKTIETAVITACAVSLFVMVTLTINASAAQFRLVIPPNEACAEYRIVKRSDGQFAAVCDKPIPCAAFRDRA